MLVLNGIEVGHCVAFASCCGVYSLRTFGLGNFGFRIIFKWQDDGDAGDAHDASDATDANHVADVLPGMPLKEMMRAI